MIGVFPLGLSVLRISSRTLSYASRFNPLSFLFVYVLCVSVGWVFSRSWDHHLRMRGVVQLSSSFIRSRSRVSGGDYFLIVISGEWRRSLRVLMKIPVILVRLLTRGLMLWLGNTPWERLRSVKWRCERYVSAKRFKNSLGRCGSENEDEIVSRKQFTPF